MTWKPISTVPNGRQVIMACRNGSVFIGPGVRPEDMLPHPRLKGMPEPDPGFTITHWMELPDPPRRLDA